MAERADIAVIGAGAAGLMASIWAARSARSVGTGRPLRVVALDGARTLGAKILVAGGGRCNVTHHVVDERAYAGSEGSTRNAIKNVLRRFDVPRTVEFFGELGVELKREETGKLFPVTDSARTVLEALLQATREAGAEVRHPWRVERVEVDGEGGFAVTRRAEAAEQPAAIEARRVILATGGMSLPKTGSDGHGYEIAEALGHTIAGPVLPALVPLTLDGERTFIPVLSGVTVRATVTLWSGSGKKLVEFSDSMLCTHFGVSGPAVLDISRHYLVTRRGDSGACLTINWLPGMRAEQVEAAMLAGGGVSVARRLGQGVDGAPALPERLARALCASAGVEPGKASTALTREERRALARATTATPLPVTGDRGFTHAEVTAGGVPLNELRLETMESRVTPGLFVCGEICDVDGRIGGFNFQWAWASGYCAGRGAAEGLSR